MWDFVKQWDFWAFITGLVVLFFIVRWYRLRMIEKVRASRDVYHTRFPNLDIVFWSDPPLDAPLPEELDWVEHVFEAARCAWPDLAEQLAHVSYDLWIVRSPTQLVGYRTRGGVEWRYIPDLVFIPESEDGQGYGGMSDRGSTCGTMWVATFFPHRPPSRLFAHELTHCVKPIRGHTSEFQQYESQLLRELGV
jgi:hypothetical protein